MTSARTTVTQVEALGGRAVRVTFGDGAVHEVDLATVFAAGGVFARLRDDQSAFEAVAVNPEFGTVEWPGGIDLDPDVLRGDREPASGAALPRRIIQAA
jgi:hypothetical protein